MSDKNSKYVSVTKLTDANTGSRLLVQLCEKEGFDDQGRYRNYDCKVLTGMMHCLLNKRLYPGDKNITNACTSSPIDKDFWWRVNHHASSVADWNWYPRIVTDAVGREVTRGFERLDKLSPKILQTVDGLNVPLDRLSK